MDRLLAVKRSKSKPVPRRSNINPLLSSNLLRDQISQLKDDGVDEKPSLVHPMASIPPTKKAIDLLPQPQCQPTAQLLSDPLNTIRILGETKTGTMMHDGTYGPAHVRVKVQKVDTRDPGFEEHRKSIYAQMTCHHNNVMRIYALEDKSPYLFVALDKFDYTLEDYLKNHDMSTKQSIQILSGIVSGVFYLHHKSLAHKDIKASNVFIKRGQHPRYTPRLGGMDKCKPLSRDDRRSDLLDLALLLLRCVTYKTDSKEKTREQQIDEFEDKLKSIKRTNREAYNFIWKLAKEFYNVVDVNQVLLDPFFWDSMKRMNFLVHANEVVGLLKPSGLNQNWNWTKDVDQRWYDTLIRNGHENTSYPDNWAGFLKFVRHTYSHILENTSHPATIEGVDWYLRETYPDLLPKVYSVLEESKKHRLLQEYY